MADVCIWKYTPGEQKEDGILPVQLAQSPKTLNEASQQLPKGVYTTLRTYNYSKVLPLEDHIRRLDESSRLVGKPHLIDADALWKALGTAVFAYRLEDEKPAEESSWRDVRIRITMDLENNCGTLFITVEALQTPSLSEYQTGVRVVTIPGQRENPKAKQTDFISTGEAFRRDLPQGVNEALLVNRDGFILEGLTSNFFAIRNGNLITADTNVLPGITRSLVLNGALAENIPVKLEEIPVSDIVAIDEAFITSSSRSILPIQTIDDIQIGTIQPGPITQRLMLRFEQVLKERLVELPVPPLR